MRLNKATHYGLYAALEMARLDNGQAVTVAEVADRYALPEGVLAKVFQQLARAGIARGTRGVGGGYRLTRDPSTLSVLDVIKALENGDRYKDEEGNVHKSSGRAESATAAVSPPIPGGASEPAVAGRSGAGPLPSPARGLERLFREVDDVARATFASTSLEILARG